MFSSRLLTVKPGMETLGPNLSRAEASLYERCASTDQEQFGQFVAPLETPSSGMGWAGRAIERIGSVD